MATTPKRGEVWLVDMGYAAKVRPALVLSVPIEGNERVITTVIPHTTSGRDTRFETRSNVRWLKDGVFDAQGIGTFPTIKLIRRLGTLPDDQLLAVESCVRMLLDLPDQKGSGYRSSDWFMWVLIRFYGPRMTRIGRKTRGFEPGLFPFQRKTRVDDNIIREDLLNPRHPRSIGGSMIRVLNAA